MSLSERNLDSWSGQSAYQRWELASLDEAKQPLAAEFAGKNSISKLAQEIAKARDDGFLAGKDEGISIGLEQGRGQGLVEGLAQATNHADAILQISRNFEKEIEKARQSVAEELLALALDLAQAMLKTALPVRPELLLPVIEQALHGISALQSPVVLHLHPLDLSLVRTGLNEKYQTTDLRLMADASLERGDCRIETPSNEVNATLGTRWQRLGQALGHPSDWLSS